MLCNANPSNNISIYIYKPKNNGHKGKSNEAQGPCQKDSVSSSLLHPKPFRCTISIGVLIHMGMITNFRIGIKV